ncbi:hypothetical protein JHK84_050304 [Glycine max]|nr:hypothetical protein JHK84_050304 [Glycine max]
MSNWFYVPAAYISLSGFVSLQERVYVMTELGLLKGSCKERLDKSIYFLNIVRISNPLYNHVQEVVCDVWCLEPQNLKPGETPIEFAHNSTQSFNLWPSFLPQIVKGEHFRGREVRGYEWDFENSGLGGLLSLLIFFVFQLLKLLEKSSSFPGTCLNLKTQLGLFFFKSYTSLTCLSRLV